jgi:phosphoenolpyruvate carboxylase
LPGWFGIGSALDVIIGARGLDATRELYAVSPFFRAMVNNAQLALARADIDVARCYATLADDDARQIFALIAAEHERTVTRVLQVASNQTLLGNRPHLAGAIERRNPQVDVLSHVQIELLGRLRAAGGEDERKRLLTALFITINGIAAGLQTAG